MSSPRTVVALVPSAVVLRFLLVLVLLPFVPLAGCASGPSTPSMADVSGSWRLAGDVPAGAKIPTLTIAADGAISGNTGVNQYGGMIDPAGIVEGQWQPGPIHSTRMAGPEAAMDVEREFLQALQNSNRLVVRGDELQLLLGETVTATLERMRLR